MIKRRIIFVTVSVLLLLSLVGCSTKKNTAGTRFFQAFTTRFNVYFNGNEAYKAGCLEIDKSNKDNYLEVIPYYPIGNKTTVGVGQSNFDRAVEKSQKSIKLHSIKKKPKKDPSRSRDPKYKEWMNRKEYNPFLYKAWMLMGKAQFQKGEFLEAASVFSYVARLYSTQPEIASEARIRMAECYSMLDWYYEAEDALDKVNNDSLPQSQTVRFIVANANLLIRQEKYAEAIPLLKQAVKKEGNKAQKARLYYLLGQIMQREGQDGEAYSAYGRCIKMNPKYELSLNARIRQTEVVPESKIPSVIKRLNKMVGMAKNQDFLDQIYYAIGNIYMARKDTAEAIKNYSLGVEKSERNGVEKGVLLLTLGNVHWEQKKYSEAQEEYKEALGLIDQSHDGYAEMNRRSVILDEFVEYSEDVRLQDSLQYVASLPEEKQLEIINKIIEEVKRQEAEQRKEEERQRLMQQREENMGEFAGMNNNMNQPNVPTINTGDDSWYFYNPQLVSQGKTEFQRKWGRRKLEDNWRRSNKTVISMDDEMGYDYDEESDSIPTDSLGNPIEMPQDSAALDNKSPEYYLSQLPTTPEQIEASNEIIKDGLFNMGMIYKDKLEDYKLADEAFGRLLRQYPEFVQMDEVLYNMFLMYSLWGKPAEANTYKMQLIEGYPGSRYAMTLSDPDFEYNARYGKHLEDSLYAETYNAFKAGNMTLVRGNYEVSGRQFAMGKHRPKFMFLYAMSELNAGKQKEFLDLMKKIVSDYPENEITEIAQNIVKGWQDGKVLKSASLGSIWQRRSVEWGENGVSADSIPSFSNDRNTRFYFILAYEKGKVDENQLLYVMATYNFSNFIVKNFDIEFQESNGVGMMRMGNFLNFDEAYYYLSRLYKDKDMAVRLEGLKPVIISESNLALLTQYYSFEDYDNFYMEYFAAIPEPEIEGETLDDPLLNLPEESEEENEDAQDVYEEDPYDDLFDFDGGGFDYEDDDSGTDFYDGDFDYEDEGVDFF